MFLPVYLHANVGRPLHQPPPCPSRSSSCCLAVSPFHPSCPSPPLLLVRMNVSSLTPLLSDFHTVGFSGSFGYFLFLILLSFFWLCKEAKCIYLRLRLGQKSLIIHFLKLKNNLCSRWLLSPQFPPLPLPGQSGDSLSQPPLQLDVVM